MKKIAILIDLEFKKKSGGHVKFWDRISKASKLKNKKIKLYIFFLGKKTKEIKINNNIRYHIKKPIISSGILKIIGIDADITDICPFNLKLFFYLRNFDLIHTTDQLFCMSKTGMLASKIWRVPLTTSYHTDSPSYSKFYVEKIIKKFPKFFSKLLISKIKVGDWIEKNQRKRISNYFSYCSYAMINDNFNEDEINKLNLKKCNLKKISRGIDKNIFKKKYVNKKLFLNKYNIPYNNKILFFCGRVHELKGSIFLSKIHRELVNKGYNITTVFAGENLDGKKCKAIGGDKIVILDYIDQTEVASFFNICELFVFPSEFETGPQVVLEAKACNSVCIVNRNGGGKKIMKSGYDGIVIENNDLAKWVCKIRELLDDDNKINNIKKNILKSFKPISWNEVFKIYFLNNWNNII